MRSRTNRAGKSRKKKSSTNESVGNYFAMTITPLRRVIFFVMTYRCFNSSLRDGYNCVPYISTRRNETFRIFGNTFFLFHSRFLRGILWFLKRAQSSEECLPVPVFLRRSRSVLFARLFTLSREVNAFEKEANVNFPSMTTKSFRAAFREYISSMTDTYELRTWSRTWWLSMPNPISPLTVIMLLNWTKTYWSPPCNLLHLEMLERNWR